MLVAAYIAAIFLPLAVIATPFLIARAGLSTRDKNDSIFLLVRNWREDIAKLKNDIAFYQGVAPVDESIVQEKN